MKISEAMESPWELVKKEQAVGRISADFYTMYPPGIPQLVPGEQITKEDLNKIPGDTWKVVKEL